MGYVLGVDLGTTCSAAAVERDGVARMAALGVRAPEVPSVVFLGEDGELLIGEPAEDHALTDPARAAREFKRRLGDPTPILVGGSPFSAHALMARLLRSVIDQVAALEGGPADHVVVTRPANWGGYKQELLAQALHQAGVEATTATEPEAAAVHHATTGRVPAGGVVAVYDLGGGTFDAAVLRDAGTHFDLLGEPKGIEQLGGVDFDNAVYGFVVDALDGAVAELDPDDRAVRSALARLWRGCVEAKEALSAVTEVTIPVALPSVERDVHLTRVQFEALVRPALAETVPMLGQALSSAEVTAGDLSAVLLVGGSSRIPLVGELVREHLDVPVAADLHPKHAVALGAAQLARSVLHAATVGSGAPAPAPDPPASPGAGESPVPMAPGREPDRTATRGARVLLGALTAMAVVAVGGIALAGYLRGRAPGGAVLAESTAIDLSAETAEAITRPMGDPLADGTIVFTHEDAGRWNLWLAEADGTGTRALTVEQAVRAALPAVSPDRRTIAYTSRDEQVWDLYLIDTRNEQKIRVARDLAPDARATWSPDATQLAFVSEAGGQRDLVVLDLATNEIRKLTDDADEEGDPAWSPDGTRLAYWSAQDLWAVPAEGGTPTHLTTAEGQEADPAWSPDGRRLAYAAKAPGGSWDIIVAGADGSDPSPVAPGAATAAGDEQDPAWSPDGTRLAFETKRDAQIASAATDDAEIYVVDADGTNAVRLTFTGGYDGHPAWATGRVEAAGGTTGGSRPGGIASAVRSTTVEGGP